MGVRKRFFIRELLGPGAGYPGQQSQSQTDGVQGASGQRSQTYGVSFELPCMEAAVELDDPHVLLTTQGIL